MTIPEDTTAVSGGTITSLLSSLQLADSMFPSGRYTLSHGLEMFVETGLVHDAESLEAVVGNYVVDTLATSEAVAVAQANRAARADDLDTLVAIDELVHALRLPWEMSSTSVRTGRQLLVTCRQLQESAILDRFLAAVDDGRAPGGHGVAFGIVTANWGISPREAAATELYAYVAALVGAALRLMRLTHVDAQLIIQRLQPVLVEATETAVQMKWQDMSTFAPTIDVMQMLHERSRMRLFAS